MVNRAPPLSDLHRLKALLADPAGDAYMACCYALAKPEAFAAAGPTAFVHRVVTGRRSSVLSELSGITVSTGTAASLARCVPKFERTDWLTLLRLSARPADRRALGHLSRITVVLLRQYDLVPPALRLPGVLAVLNDLSLSPARWATLHTALSELAPQPSATLKRLARRIRDAGDLWAFYYRVTDGSMGTGPFTVDTPVLGLLLQPLTTAQALSREGKTMKSCLARLAPDARSGEFAYYRWIGAERATVSLRRVDDAWRLDMLAGVANAKLTPSTNNAIRGFIRDALGAEAIKGVSSAVLPLSGPAVERAVELGQDDFSDEERAHIAEALRAIFGRSLAPNNGAYCILESGEHYVQFLSRVGAPSYVFEICSHHYVPSMTRALTDEVVTLLEDLGFSWPRPFANFSREILVEEDDDFESLASFALGIFRIVFGHTARDELIVKVHLPATP